VIITSASNQAWSERWPEPSLTSFPFVDQFFLIEDNEGNKKDLEATFYNRSDEKMQHNASLDVDEVQCHEHVNAEEGANGRAEHSSGY
jgi:hypothetical protein